MNKRTASLTTYGISSKRYKELCGFCEQYPEWIEEINKNKNALSGSRIEGNIKSYKKTDPTGNLAVRNVELERKCKLIEDTAIEASSDLYKFLMKSVCYGVRFKYLANIPCSRATFSDIRRYFFYLLDKKKDH